MKIYNKKGFGFGVFMVALGVLNLAADLINKNASVSGMILIAALILFGLGEMMHSMSRRMTKEARLEELDERNRLIELKSKSKSFRLTQAISFSLMLILLVIGKVSGVKEFIAMGVGLAFAYAISMFAELFTYLYYESRN